MTTTKHTPGPLLAIKDGNDSTHLCARTVFGGRHIAEVYHPDNDPDGLANVRLFMAAPELLELVESLLPLVCGLSEEDRALEAQAEALLARIRGKDGGQP